jgi:site-specific DNA-methyltransferase (adenine-specific)
MPTQRIICGDCRDVLPTLAANSVKVGFTSCMYNLGKDYGPGSPRDDRPRTEYLAEQNAVAAAVRRVLREDGHFFLNVGGNSKHPWRSVEVALEWGKHLTLQQPPLTWVKSIALDGSSLPKHLRVEMHERQVGHFQSINSEFYLNPTTELVWHFSPAGRSKIDRLRVGVPYVWADQPARFGHHRTAHCRGSAINIPDDELCAGTGIHRPYKTTQSRADRDYHPAPFPVSLAVFFLRLAGCQPGDLVIDPFCGTGATALAAQQLGLDAVGIDINPTFCAVAERRLAEAAG